MVKKIIKWIGSILVLIAGAITIFAPKSAKKKKEIKKQIEELDKEIKTLKDKNNGIKETLKNKKKILEELDDKKKNFKSKNISVKEASQFLKDFAKKNKDK